MKSSKGARFKYEEIAGYISQAIVDGVIPCGSKLPSLRRMSIRFDCSVSVVMQAYEELEKQGKTYAVEKSGFFASLPLRNPLPAFQKDSYTLKSEKARPLSIIGKIVEASNDKTIVPLGAGIPCESLLPLAALKQSIGRVLREDASLLQRYSNEAGDLRLRNEICKILLIRGIRVSPGEILITNGCTEALSLAIQAATSPGDAIAIESPVFMGAIQIMKELNRRIVSLPTSAQNGMDLDSLETTLRNGEVKAVMMTAAFQNPLGFVMPPEKRKRAVELADRYGITIIEDDLYSESSHNHSVERSLKSFDGKGKVIYCSSFSKTVSPGLRIGWMIGGDYHQKCRNLKTTQNLGGSPLLQAALADFLVTGRYDYHVKTLQKAFCRQAAEMKMLLSSAFPSDTAISSPGGGLFYWVELPGRIDTLKLFNQALKEKISLAPGQAFCSGEHFRNCLRVSFASPVTDEIRSGIRRLGNMIKNLLD